MERITSRQNATVKRLRALAKDKDLRLTCGEFVCDGVKLLDEALAHGARVTAVLWSGEPLRELSCPQYTAPRELLEYASYLKTTPGPLFSVAMPERTGEVRGNRADGRKTDEDDQQAKEAVKTEIAEKLGQLVPGDEAGTKVTPSKENCIGGRV